MEEILEDSYSSQNHKRNFIYLSKKNIRNGFISDFNQLHPKAFELFLIISAHSEDGEFAAVDLETLCSISKLSVATVHKVITKLKEAGFIEGIKQGNKPMLYKLVL